MLRHAFAQGGQRGAIAGDGDVVGALHESHFGRRFGHPAARGDGIGAHKFECRQLFPNPVDQLESDTLLHSQSSGGDTLVLQYLRCQINFAAPRPQGGAGKHQRNFARARAGEVKRTRSALHEDRIHAIFAHQPARLLDAGLPFLGSDGLDAVRHRPELAYCFRNRGGLSGCAASQTRGGANQEEPTSWIAHAIQLSSFGETKLRRLRLRAGRPTHSQPSCRRSDATNRLSL